MIRESSKTRFRGLLATPGISRHRRSSNSWAAWNSQLTMGSVHTNTNVERVLARSKEYKTTASFWAGVIRVREDCKTALQYAHMKIYCLSLGVGLLSSTFVAECCRHNTSLRNIFTPPKAM
eukprot:1316562-Amphidinium_carterae.1